MAIGKNELNEFHNYLSTKGVLRVEVQKSHGQRGVNYISFRGQDWFNDIISQELIRLP